MKTTPSTTGATAPAGVKSSDGGGERNTGLRNGVGIGKADKTGSEKLFNTGRTEGTCYTHSKSDYKG